MRFQMAHAEYRRAEKPDPIDMAAQRIADYVSEFVDAMDHGDETCAARVADRCKELSTLLWQTEDRARARVHAMQTAQD